MLYAAVFEAASPTVLDIVSSTLLFVRSCRLTGLEHIAVIAIAVSLTFVPLCTYFSQSGGVSTLPSHALSELTLTVQRVADRCLCEDGVIAYCIHRHLNLAPPCRSHRPPISRRHIRQREAVRVTTYPIHICFPRKPGSVRIPARSRRLRRDRYIKAVAYPCEGAVTVLLPVNRHSHLVVVRLVT